MTDRLYCDWFDFDTEHNAFVRCNQQAIERWNRRVLEGAEDSPLAPSRYYCADHCLSGAARAVDAEARGKDVVQNRNAIQENFEIEELSLDDVMPQSHEGMAVWDPNEDKDGSN